MKSNSSQVQEIKIFKSQNLQSILSHLWCNLLAGWLAVGPGDMNRSHNGSGSKQQPRTTSVKAVQNNFVGTHHSNAPKTVEARAALQTVPLQKTKLPKKTAEATKPANQNSMVMTSAARIPNLCAARGAYRGASVRYGTTMRPVQTPVKMRKSIWEGEATNVDMLYHEATIFLSALPDTPNRSIGAYRRLRDPSQ